MHIRSTLAENLADLIDSEVVTTVRCGVDGGGVLCIMSWVDLRYFIKSVAFLSLWE